MSKPRSMQEHAMAIINTVFQKTDQIAFLVKPADIMVTISLMQLALRHPNVSGNLAQVGADVIEQYKQALVEATGNDEIGAIVDRGFDRQYDTVTYNGQSQAVVSLTALLQQVADSVNGSVERGILYAFINLANGKSDPQMVEIDLASFLQT